MAQTPRVQLLLTGDELMSGDTVDSNSALIARELSGLGLTPCRRVTLGDDRDALAREMAALADDADVLIVNGGLGPTIDDLTAAVLGEVAGHGLEEHPDALDHLEIWCKKRNLLLNDANRKQAMLPAGCTIIPNPVGSAVGFSLVVNNCLIMCTPGVPGELRAMLPVMVQRLREEFGITLQKDVLRLQTFGLGESTAQQLLVDNHPDWPPEVVLSFRAGAPQLEIKLSITRAEDRPRRDQCYEWLKALFGDHIIGEGDTRIAEAVIDQARDAGLTITCAESCTGGMIASMLTQIAGASDVFPGGFVTYSNALKESILGVPAETLKSEGAVSEATVKAMVRGALDASGADLAVAVSGIAGPGGGSNDKPVGTVWLAWGDRDAVETVCLCWPVERVLFQTMVAAAGLDVLRRKLAGIQNQSRYFDQRRLR
ncbi:CinA family nicotinamide mononucleotide deamidase-related protein [Congregibacter litoralis]|uniref:CinA-like protein n=1 Tax=Congregibacter litoralis KT71 TaxID=314285 RepID=A4A6M1_9GAMM|nr:CinA family nicotinamide mononucleotide deamidase-related protein [Congregibacter litoralis]EAQ98668.1 competence/damage-inducible protein cinA [Congregibacter litoralis KT71]